MHCRTPVLYYSTVDTWDSAHPDVPLPGTEGGAPLPAGGMDDFVGLSFRPAVFDVFGGCSEDTMELLSSYAKKVATRQGSFAKSVLNTVYTKISYCI